MPIKEHGHSKYLGKNRSYQMKKNYKDEYNAFRDGSKSSKVPFSPEKRNMMERRPNPGQSLNKSTYGWKVPTYDLNP